MIQISIHGITSRLPLFGATVKIFKEGEPIGEVKRHQTVRVNVEPGTELEFKIGMSKKNAQIIGKNTTDVFLSYDMTWGGVKCKLHSAQVLG